MNKMVQRVWLNKLMPLWYKLCQSCKTFTNCRYYNNLSNKLLLKLIKVFCLSFIPPFTIILVFYSPCTYINRLTKVTLYPVEVNGRGKLRNGELSNSLHRQGISHRLQCIFSATWKLYTSQTQ